MVCGIVIWHILIGSLGQKVDRTLGEFCCSLLETTSTSRLSTSNKATKMETRSHLRAGTLVYSSAWFCGTRMTPRYTLCIVRGESNHAIDFHADYYDFYQLQTIALIPKRVTGASHDSPRYGGSSLLNGTTKVGL